MAASSLLLVTYDITEDSERSRVSKLLEGYGRRVQKSAFECRLTKYQSTRFKSDLRELNLKSGFIYLYPVDERAKRLAFGKTPPDDYSEDRYAYVVG